MEDGMKKTNWTFLGLVFFLAFGLVMSTGCAKKGEEQADEPTMEAAQAAETETEAEEAEEAEEGEEVELPEAVEAVVDEYVPGADIDFVEVAEEEGITLYDIEFKDERGEIEVTADGTIIDIVTIITMEELPEAAAAAIKKAAEGATILRLEKSEIHSEIKKEGEQGVVVKLDTHRFEYEAELEKDGQTGEITVDAEGNAVEPLKWDEEE